jgi:aspartyl-tRNA(Asn)/glutamyl-tRNA(Gln) amidotransferase subunit A
MTVHAEPTDRIKLSGCSALQVSGAILSGFADPRSVAEATLAAIEADADPGLFLRVTADRARAEAAASAERIRAGRARSLVDGVPIAWKDLFDLKGLVTTGGSRVLACQPPASRDATVVSRLQAVGMVSVGRVGMTEFAFSGLGINPHFGTPRNPHDRDIARIPGGSSSGCAVAVAKGLVPISIGTDTVGSVRIPAAFNGIVGCKATCGRYPMDGVFPVSRTLDSIGVLCRTVADAVIVDAAMRGRMTSAVVRGDTQGIRLVVPTNVVFEHTEPAVLGRFEAAIARLSDAGVKIEWRTLPVFDAVLELSKCGTLIVAEAYALHAERLKSKQSGEMAPRIVSRLRSATTITMVDFVAIRDTRARLIAEARRNLGADVFFAYPTVPHVAPPLRPLEMDDALYMQTNARTLRNPMLGNFLEWCSISLPCGIDEQGLPVGFLLSALGDMDEKLLGLALELEDIVRSPDDMA